MGREFSRIIRRMVIPVFGMAAMLASVASAEPWLSTRFAQNCSGCHAPQRLNVAPKDRRCSLSCQGCHTNPNGGGLRSFYGKWNDNRWLRSFRLDQLENAKNVASIKKQYYGKDPYSKRSDTQGGSYESHPLPLVEQEALSDDAQHDRSFGNEKKIAGSRDEYFYVIPEGDPWRQMGESKFNAGGDVRWLVASTDAKANGEKGKSWSNFLMSADFGMEFRPLYRHLHLVHESRITGQPRSGAQKEQILNSNIRTRSLYTLVDDLPWNSFIMGGYYRPLFGNQVPDHDALAQRMQAYVLSDSNRAQDLSYNAVTIGTAPNVPYFNLHLIKNRVGDSADQTKGLGTNFGLRFVTLGLSVNYSYWRTVDDRGDLGKVDVAMHSIGMAAMIRRTVVSYEAVSFSRDNTVRDFREGGVHTIDTMTKIWRELYVLFNAGFANTSEQVARGSASQYKAGFRSFLIPGLEMSLTYGLDRNDDRTLSQKIERNILSGQAHAYF